MKTSASRQWNATVVGLVSRLREGGARVTVPRGEYVMRELDLGRYQLSGDQKPTFELSAIEVSTYVHTKDLEIEGRWPVE